MRQKAIVLALVALVVASVAGAFIMNKSQTVMAGMSDRLETELTKALGVPVSVKSLEISWLNKVLLKDVAIRDDRGQLIAAAEKVTVVFNPLTMLRGTDTIEAVGELLLDDPQIFLERRADGKWNIDDLLDKTRSGDSAFNGKVTIRKGTVTVNVPDGRWRLGDIDAAFDFADKPDVALQLAANYNGAPLEVAGRVSRDGSSMLALGATNLDIGGLEALVPADLAVKPAGGRIAQAQVIVRRDKGEITYAGEAKLDGVNVDVGGVTVSSARGSVAFSDKQVFLFPIAARVYGQDIELRGKIATDAAEPVLSLTASAKSFDPAALGRDIPFKGPLSFTAVIGGSPTRPVVSGEVRLDKGETNGWAIGNAAAKFALVESVLTVKQLDADMFGGRISGAGTILLDKQDYNLAVSGRKLDLAALPSLGVDISGRVDIDLRLEGTGNLASAKVDGSVRAADGCIDGIPFATLSAGLYKAGAVLTIDYITVGFSGSGVMTVKGSATDGRLALNFFGQGVPLSLLADKAGGIDLSGAADVEGRVEGTTASPKATARFTAYNGRALYQPYTLAKGGLTVTRDTLTLEEVETLSTVTRQVVNGSVGLNSPRDNLTFKEVETLSDVTRHLVNGTIGLTGERELNITVATRQARAENLVNLILPGEKLTGNVDNELTITGPLASFTAEGHIKLTEGSFRGQLIARAEGHYRRRAGVTELRDFIVNSLGAEVRFAGTIAADNSLSLDVAAKDIDLAAVHVKFPYPVAGRAHFSGRLTGTPSAPVFSGGITAASLKLNGQELTDITGELSVDSDQLAVPRFGFSLGEGKFTFSGGIGFAAENIYGDLSASNGSVAALLAIFNIPAKDIDGQLDGHVSLGGTVNRPDMWLTGTLTKGKIKNYPLDNIEADIALHNNVVTVNRFYAKQGDGVLAARGTAALGGPLDLEIGGRSLDAGLLTAWLDSTVDTRGKLTFTAQVTGTSYSPHAAVSLEINGGGVANATFDAMYGLFILDKGSIHVNQLMFTKGPYRASAYGTIPLAALNPKGRAQATIADQMDLKVRLEQANLSILPLLSKEVAWATGETKGEVTVGGTLAQPLLNGSIVVNDGAVKLKSLADPIQKVGVDIQFEGDKINIITFDGSMGKGTYRLTGSAAISGLSLADYRLLLVLDKLDINHKYYKGPLEGTLTLNSSGGKPVLGGQLLFENTTINVPVVPEFSPSGLDVGLDLEIVAAKKVRLYNSYFYDLQVEGRAKFAGSTSSPAASGHFDAVRGTVSYLHTQFRVDSARADFIQFRSLLPVIKLSAETRLEYTRVKLTVSGPLDAMQIRLSSEPAMSQQQILSLLTLRNRYADRQSTAGGNRDSGLGREELMSLLDAGLHVAFVAEAESAFRNSFGLDDFRLVRSTLTTETTTTTSGKTSGTASGSASTASAVADREVYNIEIGKYVTDRLYISYTLGIDHKETSAFLRYDLNRRFSVTGAIDQYHRRQLGVEARFTF
ncbi:translocation/assembly module TamB domain-containing protein [Anaeroselena agilis]|uniref:Translocation/assembly module TamB domain-containing protein n=1 Tax=Anaeroselena agilis TaxID=3063788 RepID=A0ABU3P426_9FIRM|nr:translocation/assembly module TamB domain-containing protein [Selenomonadales bacterium 4137-cl]